MALLVPLSVSIHRSWHQHIDVMVQTLEAAPLHNNIFFFERTAKALPQFLLDDKKKKLYKRRQEAKKTLFTTRTTGTKLSILLDNFKKKLDCSTARRWP
jgi:hypothetical protein